MGPWGKRERKVTRQSQMEARILIGKRILISISFCGYKDRGGRSLTLMPFIPGSNALIALGLTQESVSIRIILSRQLNS